MVELRNIIWEYKRDQKKSTWNSWTISVPWFNLCHYLLDNKYRVQALIVILLLLNYQAVEVLLWWSRAVGDITSWPREGQRNLTSNSGLQTSDFNVEFMTSCLWEQIWDGNVDRKGNSTRWTQCSLGDSLRHSKMKYEYQSSQTPELFSFILLCFLEMTELGFWRKDSWVEKHYYSKSWCCVLILSPCVHLINDGELEKRKLNIWLLNLVCPSFM